MKTVSILALAAGARAFIAPTTVTFSAVVVKNEADSAGAQQCPKDPFAAHGARMPRGANTGCTSPSCTTHIAGSA